jgi:hypothetical protein
MKNLELINQLKQNADIFSKEEIIDIIETSGKAYVENNPFANEEEMAEESLNKLIKSIATYDRGTIQKAKDKIQRLIP